MKKYILLVLSMIIALTFISCGETKEANDSSSKTSETLDIDINKQSQHEGYFVKYNYGDAIVSITNYDPDIDTDEYPQYQELVQYGNCGIMSDDLIYYIFIVDSEDYCSFEIDAETLEVLYEENTLYTDDETKLQKKDELILMINEYLE